MNWSMSLVTAIRDMEDRLTAIEALRERAKSEIAFSSIAMEIPVDIEDVKVAAESVLDEIPMFDGHAALLADAQDRVIVYAALETLACLRQLQETLNVLATSIVGKLE